MVLRRAEALTLGALSSADNTVIGPECLSPLTSAALGLGRLSRLFAFVNIGEDPDGVIRRGYFAFKDQSGLERKSFAARAGEAFAGSVPNGILSTESRFWIDQSVDPARFQKLSWKD